MSRIHDRVFRITAAAAVVAALGAGPASAIELSASPDAAVAAAVVVAANEIRSAVPARNAAVVPIAQRRPKAVRALPVPASRPAAVAHRYRDCSGAWCGRQFVLMIGIGY